MKKPEVEMSETDSNGQSTSLEAAREAQAAGGVTTRQEALDYIRDCLLIKAE